MYSYKLSLDAESDITRLYEYGFYKFGVLQADKYYDMLFECFNKIAVNPFMFPSAKYIKKDFRFCVCDVDTIYYKITNENQVKIITIIGKQDY